jgi:hypothetical protein
MSDLENLLGELVVSAREDATDGGEGLSLDTRNTRREIREVFAELVSRRLDPLLERVIESAQGDAQRGELHHSVTTLQALDQVREAYDGLFQDAQTY